MTSVVDVDVNNSKLQEKQMDENSNAEESPIKMIPANPSKFTQGEKRKREFTDEEMLKIEEEYNNDKSKFLDAEPEGMRSDNEDEMNDEDKDMTSSKRVESEDVVVDLTTTTTTTMTTMVPTMTTDEDSEFSIMFTSPKPLQNVLSIFQGNMTECLFRIRNTPTFQGMTCTAIHSTKTLYYVANIGGLVSSCTTNEFQKIKIGRVNAMIGSLSGKCSLEMAKKVDDPVIYASATVPNSDDCQTSMQFGTMFLSPDDSEMDFGELDFPYEVKVSSEQMKTVLKTAKDIGAGSLQFNIKRVDSEIKSANGDVTRCANIFFFINIFNQMSGDKQSTCFFNKIEIPKSGPLVIVASNSSQQISANTNAQVYLSKATDVYNANFSLELLNNIFKGIKINECYFKFKQQDEDQDYPMIIFFPLSDDGRRDFFMAMIAEIKPGSENNTENA